MIPHIAFEQNTYRSQQREAEAEAAAAAAKAAEEERQRELEKQKQEEYQRQQDAIPDPAGPMDAQDIPDPAATLEKDPAAFGLRYDAETGCYYEE